MKKLLLSFLLLSVVTVFGQFKDPGFPTSTIRDGIVAKDNGPLLGFLNSENFKMTHSYNLSYSTFGNQGLALGVYTNSMFYKIADNFNVQLDASIVHSPYSSFGKDVTNQLTGLYISKAAINYQPWKDFNITVQYRRAPNYYNPYFNRYDDGFGYYDNPFFR